MESDLTLIAQETWFCRFWFYSFIFSFRTRNVITGIRYSYFYAFFQRCTKKRASYETGNFKNIIICISCCKFWCRTAEKFILFIALEKSLRHQETKRFVSLIGYQYLYYIQWSRSETSREEGNVPQKLFIKAQPEPPIKA